MVATFDNKKLVAVKDIKIKKGMTANDLVKMMGKSGGFTAQKLSDAADIVEKMFKKKDCLRILSFPACIMAGHGCFPLRGTEPSCR